MTRLLWGPSALDDREQIMDYIAQDNPAAAVAMDDEIEAKAEQARKHPTLYRKGRVNGTREAVIPPNHIMVYQYLETAGIVRVLRVLHARQQWPKKRD